MDRDLLLHYYDTEIVEDYHGCPIADTYRALSLDKRLPESLIEYFCRCYDKSILDLGCSRVDKFGQKLYDMLNGAEPPEILQTVDSNEITIAYKDWSYSYTVKSVRVRIPYFVRVVEYCEKIGRPIRLETEYDCIDIEHNGRSLLKEAIEAKYASQYFRVSGTMSSHSQDFPWIIDDVQYMIVNGLCKTMNGYGAAHFVGMSRSEFRDAYRRDDSEVERKRVDYVNRVIEHVAYFIPDDIRKAFKLPTRYDLQREYDRIDKGLTEAMNILW